MKAKLIFDFDIPEEAEEFRRMQQHRDFVGALYQISRELRSLDKHQREGYDAATVEKIREFFIDTLNEYHLEIG